MRAVDMERDAVSQCYAHCVATALRVDHGADDGLAIVDVSRGGTSSKLRQRHQAHFDALVIFRLCNLPATMPVAR